MGVFGPMLSAGFVQIAGQLGTSVNTLSQSTAWFILTIDPSLFIANPIVKKMASLHRRQYHHVRFQSLGSICICSLVEMCMGWYGSIEILVQCTVGDLYFVH